MGRLADWLNQWEEKNASRLRRVVLPEEGADALIDADEIGFFGVVRTLPQSMAYLLTLGTPLIEPEVYIVGIKHGERITPSIWTVPSMRAQLETIARTLMQDIVDIINLCAEEGFFPPTAIKTVVAISTGETFTKYEFDPLPAAPHQGMTAADWAFKQWLERVRNAGNAMKEVEESKKQNK